MEINRNQYFLAGLVVLLLGLQLRMVSEYVLNEKASRFVEARFASSEVASRSALPAFLAAATAPTQRTVKPPTWIGWALLSAGAVLVLHSLAMKKPGG